MITTHGDHARKCVCGVCEVWGHMEWRNYNEHISSNTCRPVERDVQSTSRLDDLLQRPLKVQTSLARRSLSTSSEPILHMKTGGKVFY